MDILQSVTGPSIEQVSDYFEFSFQDLNDANGTNMSFSGYTAEVQVLSLYSDTPVFTIPNSDITMSADDISVSYDTSEITAYTHGEYRYKVFLTVGGKTYERIRGRVYKK